MSRPAAPTPQRYVVLSPEDVRLLVSRYQQTGEARSGDALVRSHYRLIAKIARKYRWSRQDPRDLIQAGCLGFLRAIEKYDLGRGVQLSTYAVPWIRAFITRHILDNWRLVRIGKTARQRRLFHQADSSALSPADLLLQHHLRTAELSLDVPISSGDGALSETHVSLLRADEDARPDRQVETEEARQRLRDAVARFASGLDGRERHMFDERWRRDEPPTLAALGIELGISRERARQLERRLLDRLEMFLSAEIGDLRELAQAA